MITVYDVIAEYGTIATYIEKEKADRHCNHAAAFCRRPGEFVRVEARETDRMPRESVHVTGYVLCYQFSRTTNGMRSFVRTIENMHMRPHNVTGEMVPAGFVTILDRRVLVQYHPSHIPGSRIDCRSSWVGLAVVD